MAVVAGRILGQNRAVALSGTHSEAMTKQPERARIRIRSDVDLYRRAEMITRLERQRGILSAHFEPGDARLLIVHYRQGGFSHGTLVDLIEHHGVAAEALPD